MITVLSSASARPNFVKLAAVHHALLARKEEFKHVIVHTGQHYDALLSDIFFKQLKISQPDYNLGVKGGADREAIIQTTAAAMKPVLQKVKPDIVLVYGDVNGAVGAARAAKELGIKIGHVEAGLRSGDLTMPEENNRIEIDKLADLLFVSELSGQEHLIKEKAPGEVHFVGNTMIDTLIKMIPLIKKEPPPLDLPDHFAIVTLHRPSNVDTKENLKISLDFLTAVSANVTLLLPLHPRIRARLQEFNLAVSNKILVTDPLGYIPFLSLVRKAAFILTDSGGIQEEATFLGKRCFTLRRNTERPSTEKSGSNMLIDPEKPAHRKAVLDFAAHPTEIKVQIPEKWDGKAGERIVEELRGFLS
jgi:UDP-N-acetylglucosamine 2-epimerase (non-hydrolysing)